MRPVDKVLLVFPPVSFSPQAMKQCHLPLGLAYLAAVIRDRVEVSVLDAAAEGWTREESAGPGLLRFGLPMADIEQRIRQVRPDMVGISCIFSSQLRNTVEVARAAKRVDRSIVTITGGTHPTFLSEQSMEACPELDFIVRGEGEQTLLEVIEASRDGRDPAEIAGLVWRGPRGVVVNPPREPYPDLDDLPFPARDLFDLDLYQKIGTPMGTVYRNRPYMNLITSRGCPFRCTFCSSACFWANRYRARSPGNVLAEIQHLVNDLGVRELKFFDDNLTSDRERARAIFRGMIDRGIEVTWNTPNGIHAASLDAPLLNLMKESGCFELSLAVESGNAHVLRHIIHKPAKLDQIERTARLIKERGIATNGFFIIGFPGETRRQIQDTLDFSLKLDLDRMSLFIFNPLPGTALFDLCVEQGLISADRMAEGADFFQGRFDTGEWTHQELQAMRKWWFWRYNARLLLRSPRRFVQNYLHLFTSPRQAAEVIKRLVRS